MATARSDRLVFFREWLKNPLRTAAVIPSSGALARAMCAGIDFGECGVIELGGGTGVFTRELILRGVRQESLYVLESNPVFAEALGRAHPKIHVRVADARRLNESEFLTDARGLPAVVSGLPILTMTKLSQRKILSGAFRRLLPDGTFVQFTYGLASPFHASVLEALGLQDRRMQYVVTNLPPAWVWRVTRL